jgi:c-di-GMP-binding flagellar brake protein YcgR
MNLSEMEARVLKTCCEENEKLIVFTTENDKKFAYKSRFLFAHFDKDYIIIDEPSPDTSNARPISKGQYIEIFFETKLFRYLFESRVLEHTTFKLNYKAFHALKIQLPSRLKDGDKREYYRIETGLRPPIEVKFKIYKNDSQKPVMSDIIPDQPEEFIGEMVNISGGGFALRAKLGAVPLPLERGDIIDAVFKLREDLAALKIWSEVRNFRKYRDSGIVVWGFRFLGREKNEQISLQRNKILRYVIDRQRELLAK